MKIMNIEKLFQKFNIRGLQVNLQRENFDEYREQKTLHLISTDICQINLYDETEEIMKKLKNKKRQKEMDQSEHNKLYHLIILKSIVFLVLIALCWLLFSRKQQTDSTRERKCTVNGYLATYKAPVSNTNVVKTTKINIANKMFNALFTYIQINKRIWKCWCLYSYHCIILIFIFKLSMFK